jgi:hypothetical protein
MTIPDEAVEAAAKASFAHWQPHKVWGESRRVADIFMEDARIILESAEPYMLAAKVADAKANNDHIIEGGDGYSAGFHYALHCVEGDPK